MDDLLINNNINGKRNKKRRRGKKKKNKNQQKNNGNNNDDIISDNKGKIKNNDNTSNNNDSNLDGNPQNNINGHGRVNGKHNNGYKGKKQKKMKKKPAKFVIAGIKKNKGINNEHNYVNRKRENEMKQMETKVNKKNDLNSIMNEQVIQQDLKKQNELLTPNVLYGLNDDDLLEQQLLYQALSMSTKEMQNNNNNNTNNDNNIDDDLKNETKMENNSKTDNNDTKTDTNDNSANNNIDSNKKVDTSSTNDDNKDSNKDTLQDNADLLLALEMQQRFDNEYEQRITQQKLDKIYNGAHCKQSNSIQPKKKKKLTLQFTDDNILDSNKNNYIKNDNRDMDSDDDNGLSEPEILEINERIGITRHNKDVWNQVHYTRLNNYDTMGNLKNNVHLSNKAFNAFKNKLDKFSYIIIMYPCIHISLKIYIQKRIHKFSKFSCSGIMEKTMKCHNIYYNVYINIY